MPGCTGNDKRCCAPHTSVGRAVVRMRVCQATAWQRRNYSLLLSIVFRSCVCVCKPLHGSPPVQADCTHCDAMSFKYRALSPTTPGSDTYVDLLQPSSKACLFESPHQPENGLTLNVDIGHEVKQGRLHGVLQNIVRRRRQRSSRKTRSLGPDEVADVLGKENSIKMSRSSESISRECCGSREMLCKDESRRKYGPSEDCDVPKDTAGRLKERNGSLHKFAVTRESPQYSDDTVS